MMKKILIVLGIACVSLTSRAQFNDSTFYHLALNAKGSLNKTTTGSAYLLNNGLNFGMRKKDVGLNWNSSWLYGKQDSQLTNNDFSSTLNFNLYKSIPHFYYWGLLNYTTSRSLRINHQVQAGLGVAYNLIDKRDFNLNISDGLLYDTSNLLADRPYQTYRNSLRLQYRLAIKELFLLEGSNFLQNSLKDGSDYLVRSTNKLGVKLKKWMSLTTALTYNRMNITRRENLNLTYGITIDKYF